MPFITVLSSSPCYGHSSNRRVFVELLSLNPQTKPRVIALLMMRTYALCNKSKPVILSMLMACTVGVSVGVVRSIPDHGQMLYLTRVLSSL